MSDHIRINTNNKQQEQNRQRESSEQVSGIQSFGTGEFGMQTFSDDRPEVINNSPQVQQAAQLQSMIDNSARQVAQKKKQENIFGKETSPLQPKTNDEDEMLQAKENNTGLPDNLKSGVENLSGISMDGVKVHYNSAKPQQLNALAYAQGNDIHVGSGQEKHLPHEAWHVVQQRQGRVKPTMQMKGVVVNNESELEKEADEMGKLAVEGKETGKVFSSGGVNPDPPVQRFEAPGHEAAERTALTEKRGDGKEFTNEEASMTYFGNWMRDMNQLMVPAFTDIVGADGAFALIKVLAFKKFGREINPEQFGYYIPSEHLDSPAGQVQGQDYFANPPAVSSDVAATGKDRFNTQDFPARPQKYDTPQETTDPAGTVLGANLFAVDQNGVMAYIRRTNMHVERRLELAAIKGRTPEGLMHLGAALHAVEDLFSHSNFVEIALDKILQENPAVKADGQPGLLPQLTGANRKVETLSPKMADGRPVMVTGSFTGLDTLHSVGSEGIKMLKVGLKPAPQTESGKPSKPW